MQIQVKSEKVFLLASHITAQVLTYLQWFFWIGPDHPPPSPLFPSQNQGTKFILKTKNLQRKPLESFWKSESESVGVVSCRNFMRKANLSFLCNQLKNAQIWMHCGLDIVQWITPFTLQIFNGNNDDKSYLDLQKTPNCLQLHVFVLFSRETLNSEIRFETWSESPMYKILKGMCQPAGTRMYILYMWWDLSVFV